MTMTTLGSSAKKNVSLLEAKNRDTFGKLFQFSIAFCLVLSLALLSVLLFDVISDGWYHLTERLGAFLSGSLRSRSIDEQFGSEVQTSRDTVTGYSAAR